MPDIYISRAGVESIELDQKFASTENAAAKDILARAEQRAKVKDDRIEQLENLIFQLQRDFDAISIALKRSPSEAQIIAAQKAKVLSG
jgi:hypothetical protein